MLVFAIVYAVVDEDVNVHICLITKVLAHRPCVQIYSQYFLLVFELVFTYMSNRQYSRIRD